MKEKIVGLILGAAFVAAPLYVTFQLGKAFERDKIATQTRFREQGLIQVNLKIRYPNGGMLFDTFNVPVDGEITRTTEIGVLSFRHDPKK